MKFVIRGILRSAKLEFISSISTLKSQNHVDFSSLKVNAKKKEKSFDDLEVLE